MTGKRWAIAFIGALILILTVMPLSPYLAMVSAADDPASEESHSQAIIPATIDPTANLPSGADAHVRDWYPTENYGDSSVMYAGHDVDQGTFRSFVFFDLSSIPSGSTINSASFHAYVDGVGGSPTIEVYRVLSSWGEYSVNWNNQPSVPLSPVRGFEVTSDDVGEWIHWDMTDLVGVWWAGTPNYGLSLRGPEGSWARFHTRQTTNTPYLLVNYQLPPGVTPSPEAPDTTPPQVSIFYSPESPMPDVDEVTFTATASDLSGIARIEIRVNGEVHECLTSPCWCTAGPYPEGTVVTYAATAWDTAGNQGETGDEYLTIGPPRDTTPPQVSITYAPESPMPDVDEVTFTATALDASGIEWIEIYVNDIMVANCSASTCIYSGGPYLEGTVPVGTISYAARARDGAGNLATVYDFLEVPANLCDGEPLPRLFDWSSFRLTNWLTSVKDQSNPQRCGSCWAFATVAAMEAKYNIEQNDILNIDLSEQYLVSDCYPPANCGGRAPNPQARMHTLDYIENNGITDEACFPYIASNSPCNRCGDWSTRLWKINSYGRVGINTDDIKRALLCHGPLIACGCGHCIVLVGWNDAINSWIIKNSWGIGWENGGYGTRAYGHCWIGDVYYVEGVGRD